MRFIIYGFSKLRGWLWRRELPVDLRSEVRFHILAPTLRVVFPGWACQMSLATSRDANVLKTRGCEMQWMTWRAMGLANIARHVKGSSSYLSKGDSRCVG